MSFTAVVASVLHVPASFWSYKRDLSGLIAEPAQIFEVESVWQLPRLLVRAWRVRRVSCTDHQSRILVHFSRQIRLELRQPLEVHDRKPDLKQFEQEQWLCLTWTNPPSRIKLEKRWAVTIWAWRIIAHKVVYFLNRVPQLYDVALRAKSWLVRNFQEQFSRSSFQTKWSRYLE